MSKFIALTKVLLRTNGESLGKRNGKIRLKGIAMIVFLIICLMPLGIGLGGFVNKVYNVLQPINQQGALLGLGFSVVSMIIFFFGIFYVMGTFYFSMDIEYLLPLPFRPSQIVAAKLTVVLIYEYLTGIIILAPIIISYGISGSTGMLYYLYGILIFLTLPIIPLIISSIIVMVIMRFTTIAKNKDRFKTIGGMIAIFLGIGINFFMQKIGVSLTSPEKVQRMFTEGNNSLLDLTTSMFPSSKLAALALAENNFQKGIVNLGLFLIITIAALLIFNVIGEGLYLRGIIGISETTTKRKELSGGELSKATVQNSVLKAYTIKELKVLFRTPAYFLNCVLLNFVWPIILIVPMFMGSGDIDGIGMINNYIHDPKLASTLLGGATMALVFVSSSNAIAATAISREGRNLFFNKYIPVSYKTQIMAKVLSGFLLTFGGATLIILTLIVIAKPPILLVISIVLVGLLAILFSCFVGILIDLVNPKLDWDNEQKAVKQNMNVMINLVPCVVFPGLMFLLIYKGSLSFTVASVLLFILYLIIDVILYKILMTKGVRVYENI